MLSGWQFMLGGLVLTAAGLLFGGRLTQLSLRVVLLILYLALLSAVAYSLWSLLLKYNDVSRVAVCGFMIPVFGFILSALFSGGDSGFGLPAVAALLLVTVGTVTVNLPERKNGDH